MTSSLCEQVPHVRVTSPSVKRPNLCTHLPCSPEPVVLASICGFCFLFFGFFSPNYFSNFSWYLADLGAKSEGQGGGCCLPCHVATEHSGWGSRWSGFWEHLADVYSLGFSTGSDTARRKHRPLQAHPRATSDLSEKACSWGGGVQRGFQSVCKTRRERTFQFGGRSLG